MKEEKVRKALSDFFHKRTALQCVPGKVVAVNTTDMTCDVEPIDGGAKYFDVRIRASIDGNGIGVLPQPKVNSMVVIAMLNNKDASAFVLLYDELTEYKIICNNIKLNGDQFGGLVKIEELHSAINRLEQRFNQHTHPGNNTVTATQIAPVTTRQQLENQSVKHG